MRLLVRDVEHLKLSCGRMHRYINRVLELAAGVDDWKKDRLIASKDSGIGPVYLLNPEYNAVCENEMLRSRTCRKERAMGPRIHMGGEDGIPGGYCDG